MCALPLTHTAAVLTQTNTCACGRTPCQARLDRSAACILADTGVHMQPMCRCAQQVSTPACKRRYVFLSVYAPPCICVCVCVCVRVQLSFWKTDKMLRPIHVMSYEEQPGCKIKLITLGPTSEA